MSKTVGDLPPHAGQATDEFAIVIAVIPEINNCESNQKRCENPHVISPSPSARVSIEFNCTRFRVRDVPRCEYIEMPAGGLMWTSRAIAVPVKIDREEEHSDIPELPWGRIQPSESWGSVLYGYDTDEEWTRFRPDAPQDPSPEPRKKRMGPGRVIPMRRRPI